MDVNKILKSEARVAMFKTIRNIVVILTVVLIILKTTGIIDWSWWIVWAPLLLYVAFPIFCLIFAGVGLLLNYCLNCLDKKKNN